MKISKFIYQYGLFTGMVGIIYGIMRFILDTHYEDDIISISVGISILLAGIILGQLAYRKANDGLVSYNECLKIGVGIGLISAIVSYIYLYIFSNIIEPDFNLKSIEIGFAKAMEADPEFLSKLCEIRKICTQNEFIEMALNNVWLQYPLGIAFVLFLSFMFSLCSGIVIKKSE